MTYSFLAITVAFVLLFSQHSLANNDMPATGDSVTPDIYCDEDGCREFSRWRVGVGAGGGRRTNPLINSDDIDIYWFVDLSYFGDHFFFDNGDLGATFYATENISLNAIVSYGNESTFFSHLNDESFSLAGIVERDGNTGLDSEVPGLTPAPPDDTADTASMVDDQDPPDRDGSIEGGIEMIYTVKYGEIHTQLLTDISSTHNGNELWFSYSIPSQWGRFKLVPALGFSWKSKQLVDYYYGVRTDEATGVRPFYEADSDTTNAFLKLSLSYRLSTDWQLVSVLEYQTLGNAITSSPIVRDDSLSTYFMGLFYRF